MVDTSLSDMTVTAAPQGKSPKKKLFTIIKVVASLGLITWIISTANLADVYAALKTVDVRWLLLAVCLQFVGAGLISFRWKGLLAVQSRRRRI